MRNKKFLYRHQTPRQEQFPLTLDNNQNLIKQSNKIFDIHFAFFQPQAHPVTSQNRNKTYRKSHKNITTISTTSTPKSHPNNFSTIQLSLTPQHKSSEGSHRPREIKFNTQQKFQTIHSVKNQKNQTSSSQVQKISSSRVLGTEAKKKLRKKIIEGFGLINFLECSTLDLRKEAPPSNKLIVEGNNSRTLNRSLLKTYSQRWRHSSTYTRKISPSHRQERPNQNKLVSPWSTTHRDKLQYHSYDSDFIEF